MRTAPRMLAAASVLLAVTALSACSAPAAKPADLAVKVYQLRSDYAIRGDQIEITNRGSSGLTITSATFGSAWFASTVSSPSAPNPLAAQSTVDFRVILSAGRCDAATADPVVHLHYRRSDGSTGEETIVPSIPFQSISVVHGQDCSRQEFEKVAKISIAPTLRFDPAVAPGGADTGQRVALIDVTFTAASPPTTVTLDYTPAGCIQHRIAEDKIAPSSRCTWMPAPTGTRCSRCRSPRP